MITAGPSAGHQGTMSAAVDARLAPAPRVAAPREPPATTSVGVAAFEANYEEHVDFVWRSARRLGVPDAGVDDAVQEVFVVVHRRLAEFEARSSIRTWLYGIVLRVARTHRRTARRRQPERATAEDAVDPDLLADGPSERPDACTERAEALRILQQILDELEDERREVFVLAELEMVPVTEVAEALGANVNTVHSRLRAARRDFEKAVARHRARDGWRIG